MTAEVHDEYGGWSDSMSYEVNIERRESSGGGGCPYVSPWDGEEYRRDNNLLIGSEYKDGIVDDHYVLEESLEPKDETYQLKVEEFKNTENYFDQLALYTIDHPENYKIGTTSEGEVVSYQVTRELYDDNTRLKGAESEIKLELEEILENRPFNNEEKYLRIRSSNYRSRDEVEDNRDELQHNPPIHPKSNLGLTARSTDREEEISIFDEAEIYPRNHRSDLLLPINKIEDEILSSFNRDEDVDLLLESDEDFYLACISLVREEDDKIQMQEAELERAVFNRWFDVTDMISNPNSRKLRQIPGDEIHLTFDIPEKSCRDAERSYLIFSRGRYDLYESDSRSEGVFDRSEELNFENIDVCNLEGESECTEIRQVRKERDSNFGEIYKNETLVKSVEDQ